MIDHAVIEKLYQQTKKGDCTAAAQIYRERFRKTITSRYLEYFIKGIKTPSHTKHSHHIPLQMFEAIAEAVAQRQARERTATAMALEKLDKIIHIERPATIAL